jgi:hypothetical protein
VEYSTSQSKLKKIASGVGRFIFQSTAESRLREIVEDLKKELLRVRIVVRREHQWMSDLRGGEEESEGRREGPSLQSKRQRLIALFVRDLSSGICGEVLASHAQRSHSQSASSSRVMMGSLVVGWIAVVLMNLGMLLYVYLFAMTQSPSRQSAWFQSFVMWIIFEIFVSSTGLVIFFHLMVPLCVLTEVTKIKEKVLCDLILFRENYLRRVCGGGDQRTAAAGDGVTIPKNESAEVEFNAAKYLFVSWRVASLFPELPESGLVRQFSTPWPKKKFGEEASDVAREYDQTVILTALSRVLLYFVASLLRYHVLVQDILIQLVCNSAFGGLVLLLITSARVHPLLPVGGVLALFLCLCLLLKYPTASHSSPLPVPPSSPPAAASNLAAAVPAPAPHNPPLRLPLGAPPSVTSGAPVARAAPPLVSREESEILGEEAFHFAEAVGGDEVAPPLVENQDEQRVSVTRGAEMV